MAWLMRGLILVFLAALAYDTFGEERYAVLGVPTIGPVFSCDTREAVLEVIEHFQLEHNADKTEDPPDGCGLIPAVYVMTDAHETYGVQIPDEEFMTLRLIEIVVIGIMMPEGPAQLAEPLAQWTWTAYPVITKQQYKTIQSSIAL